ncbi:MAG: hypothetical protein LWW95_08405 [Candidatus Desulfofervidus auxilii]|nr:hypothetical protein [Candidatus Desulfofervidus auxilii]
MPKPIKIVIQPETPEEAKIFVEKAHEIEDLIDFLLRTELTPGDVKNIVERYLGEEVALRRIIGYSDLELEGLVEIDEGYGGLVIDEAKAELYPCTCYDIGEGKKLCFSKGIIGALTEEQIKKYCKKGIVHKTSERLKERIMNFRKAVRTCWARVKALKIEKKGKKLEKFWQCMSEWFCD